MNHKVKDGCGDCHKLGFSVMLDFTFVLFCVMYGLSGTLLVRLITCDKCIAFQPGGWHTHAGG